MAYQQYANLAASTLASSYTSGDSTITLHTGDGALFPSSGDFIVGLGTTPDFLLKCTSRSGDVLTVSVTAQESTTLSNKASGTVVTQLMTAGVLDLIRSDQCRVGLYSALPTSGMRIGDRYRTTNRRAEFIYDGTNWNMFYLGLYFPGPLTALPTFAWRNQGSALLTSEPDMEYVLAPVLGGNNLKGREINVPGSTPWTITACIHPFCTNTNYNSAGLYVSDGTKCVLISTSPRDCSILQYSNAITFSSGPLTFANTGVGVDQPLVVRLQDNGTNHIFGVSTDGINFNTVQQSRTAYLTATKVGYYVEANNTSIGAAVRMVSWKQS